MSAFFNWLYPPNEKPVSAWKRYGVLVAYVVLAIWWAANVVSSPPEYSGEHYSLGVVLAMALAQHIATYFPWPVRLRLAVQMLALLLLIAGSSYICATLPFWK